MTHNDDSDLQGVRSGGEAAVTAPERLPGECPPHGERVRYESADRGPTEPACTCERVTAPEPTPYTPTDDEVRGWIAQWDRDALAEFDRWLAAHDERVRAEARRDALNEAADVMSADTTLYADLEALCEKSANPSTLADQVQDAAVAWLRAAETPGGAA